MHDLFDATTQRGAPLKIVRGALTRPLKRFVRRRLASLGFVLVRKADFDRMYAASAPAGTPGPAPFEPLHKFVAQMSDNGTNTRHLFEEIGKICNLSRPRIGAIYSALRSLHASAVPGDVVESGATSIQTLIAIGAVLSALQDTNRRLVLLDIGVDPIFRTEPELVHWGRNSETKPEPALRRNRISAGAQRIVPELVRSGYPAGNIVMGRFPEDLVLVSGPIAYLGLTSSTYPANRVAIGELYPRLSPGGIVSVDDEGLKAGRRDAVSEYLDDEGIALQFTRATETCRIGVKPAHSASRS